MPNLIYSLGYSSGKLHTGHIVYPQLVPYWTSVFANRPEVERSGGAIGKTNTFLTFDVGIRRNGEVMRIDNYDTTAERVESILAAYQAAAADQPRP
jgi:hypothetical protein